MYFERSRSARHTQRQISANRIILARHIGSKTTNFQQQFLKTKTNSVVSDDNDNNPGAEDDDDDDEADSYNYQPSNEVIISESMDWIKKVVIGYNLCPFAERPLRENKLKVSVVRGNNDQHVAAAVVYELIARSDQPGTTVVVAPEYYPDDFRKYFSLVQLLEDDVMEEHELDGIVQIAPFHPLFEFGGSGAEGIDNYTNRSPYPMFHILREDEVEKAVEKLGGDASKVWSRNIRLLETMQERLGKEGTERAMRGEAMDGVDELLKEVKLSGYDEKDLDKSPDK